jgi:ADP-heptose:LPS heptosyltransferase
VADTGPRRHEDTKAPDGESPLPEGEGQGEGTPPTEVSGEGRPRCCLLDPGREAPRASHSLRLAMLRVAGAALRAVSPTRPSRRPERPRVLLIRPDHLGDTLLTTPAVELLRKALPDARLTMLVGPWSEEMARRDPLLDEVLVLPFPGFTRAPKGSYLAPYRLLRQAASELRRGSYDAALVLRFDHWWGAWLAALAGIPTRVGYGVRECVPFLTDAQPPPDRLHWTAQSLALVDALPRIWEGGRTDAGVPTEPAVRPGVPALRFPTGEKDARRAGAILNEARFAAHRPLVVFHPGSGSPMKAWHEEHWTHLGWTLAARGAQVVVTGSAAEARPAGRIADATADARSVAGRTDLGTLAALFGRAALVVGVDSGPLHLAVAVGARTVHLFGPTDPAVYGPWGDPARHRIVRTDWPNAPCGRLDLEPPGGDAPPCMRAIAPERVAMVCREVLSAEC